MLHAAWPFHNFCSFCGTINKEHWEGDEDVQDAYMAVIIILDIKHEILTIICYLLSVNCPFVAMAFPRTPSSSRYP